MLAKMFAKQIEEKVQAKVKEQLTIAFQDKELELENKKNELDKEREELNKLVQVVQDKEKEIQKRSGVITRDITELRRLEKENEVKEKELKLKENNLKEMEKELDNSLFLQDCGIHEVNELFYRYNDSDDYKQAIQILNGKMEQMVVDGEACVCHTQWTINGSKTKGNKQTKNTIKMALRLFNAETNNYITSIGTRSNIINVAKKIQKSGDAVNRFCQTQEIELKQNYIDCKIELATLVYEQIMKKQQEKEEARRQAEIIREQEKLEREIDKEREKLAKEIKQYQTEINRLYKTTDSNTGELTEESAQRLEELQTKIEELQERDVTLEERIHNKAGWVYIITNDSMEGCKIGVTRRLDPQDRIDELGSASVPFRFNKNCVIFSEDAFALESQLHKAFHSKRVNKVNNRREFFNVSTKEVEEYVRQNIDSTVQFLHDIHNEEYLLSM